MLLKEEQFKVLKTLIEATSRMDLNMFAGKVNLTPDQTIRLIQELAKEGFLQKVGGGYGITQKGKAALRAFMPVPKDTGFRFYYGINQPSDFTAESLEQFYRLIKQISAESLEFHLYRGDFENWLKEACKDTELASAFMGVKAADLRDEKLRKELLKVLDAKYGIEGLV
jgi:DNA-binding Lrp family transcriptional regulator